MGIYSYARKGLRKAATAAAAFAALSGMETAGAHASEKATQPVQLEELVSKESNADTGFSRKRQKEEYSLLNSVQEENQVQEESRRTSLDGVLSGNSSPDKNIHKEYTPADSTSLGEDALGEGAHRESKHRKNEYYNHPDYLKDASLFEKAVVRAPALGWYVIFPGFVSNIAVHEGIHSLAALSVGAGVKEYSILPPVFSERKIKEQKYGQNFDYDAFCKDGLNAQTKACSDISGEAFTGNMVHAGALTLGIGAFAYMEPRTPIKELSRAQKAIISLSPYLADVGFSLAFKEQIMESWDNKSPFFDHDYFNDYHLAGLTVSSGGALLSLFGIGDFAILSDAILPSKDYPEWYHELGRRVMGFAVGAGISALEVQALRDVQ